MRHRFLLAIGVALAAAACSKQPEPPAAAAPAPGVPAANAAAPAATASAGSIVSGPVLETMDAASYTYVRVKSGESAIWAAAPQFAVKVGDRVTVPLEMPMNNFHSQALNRDFPLIYFVTKIAREGETLAAGGSAQPQPPQPIQPTHPTMSSGHGGGASITIAELWAKRKALEGKPVTVRGRVVKFNGGILGKNWIHLQDGTGKAEDRTNDITVMAREDVNVKVGDTVTLAGTVVLDKDLGSGYAYATIIDNARLVARQ